jgi:hypothetical protein
MLIQGLLQMNHRVCQCMCMQVTDYYETRLLPDVRIGVILRMYILRHFRQRHY